MKEEKGLANVGATVMTSTGWYEGNENNQNILTT